MASNTSCYAKLVPSFLVIFLLSITWPAFSSSKQDLFRTICHKTPDPEFCYTFFNQNVFAGATPESLSELTIRKSLDNATSTQIFIANLIKTSPKPQQDIYKICQVCFDAITNQLVDASFAFSSRDYRSAQDDVSKTERPVDDCRTNVNISPDLNRMSWDMKRLIEMTLSAMSLLPQ